MFCTRAYGRSGSVGVRQGAVYLFNNAGSSWDQIAVLVPSDSTKFDAFGESIGMDSQTMAVGAYGANMAAGHVYTFKADTEIQTAPPVTSTSLPTAAPSAAPQAKSLPQEYISTKPSTAPAKLSQPDSCLDVNQLCRSTSECCSPYVCDGVCAFQFKPSDLAKGDDLKLSYQDSSLGLRSGRGNINRRFLKGSRHL